MSDVPLPFWAAAPAAFLLICAGALALIGSIGLLRMKTFYARMHPPTMGTILGTGCVLIASMLVSAGIFHRAAIHETLIIFFVAITSPVTAMTLMRAAVYRAGSESGDEAAPPHGIDDH